MKKFKTLFWIVIYPVIGIMSLCWFMVRVIPKPSRAVYPCQRVAFSLASGFIGYVLSLFISVLAFRRAVKYIRDYRYLIASLFIVFSLFAVIWHLNLSSGKSYAWTPSDSPNNPMGTARGIYPGRVVWVHDPEATSWDGSTGFWWEDTNTDQSVVSEMLSKSIRWLTEESTDSTAWDALFRYFNQNHSKGDIGYQSGEKIAIKINLNTCDSHETCENASYTSPQMVLALLRQLVQNAGVPDSLISCYDVIRLVPSTIFDRCRTEFPNVRFVEWQGGDGREKYVRDTTCIVHWSEELTLEIGGGNTTYLPTCVEESDYIINLASLKGHNLTGVTLCAKNDFGSFDADRDGAPYQSAPKAAGVHPYVAVHDYSFGPEWTFEQRDMGTYNALVDLMGHEHLGNKTLLFMIEGLYGAVHQSVRQSEDYCKWLSTPFNNDWPSSLFISQDGVATESVALDFLRSEPNMTQVYGNVDNYLHEAAQADDPPSTTFYDPEADGTNLSSLGVHEHWNDSVDKQYSRNLGIGEGIELISSDPTQSISVGIRVYLEGPYDASGDTMTTSLRDNGHIPLTSPYTEDPRTAVSIPENITDWVLVQLRTTTDGSAIASKSAFLRNDGWIVSDNGITPYITMDVSDGDYYIVVKHRNHCAVMSASLVALK